jgi:hypothetical protein
MSIHVPFSKLFQSKAKGRAWGNCHIGQSAVREEEWARKQSVAILSGEVG